MFLWDKSELSRSIFVRVLDRSQLSYSEHCLILDAIKSRDDVKVREVYRAHIKDSFDVLFASLVESDQISKDNFDETSSISKLNLLRQRQKGM